MKNTPFKSLLSPSRPWRIFTWQLKSLLSLVTISLLLSSTSLSAQKSALVLIDIQDFYFPGGAAELVEPEAAAEKASVLLEKFHSSGDLVVHVVHKVKSGGDIYKMLKPGKNDLILSKEAVNAFKDTNLDSILKAHEITEVVLAGMQTHMCLEAATRAAADRGYSCTVIDDACATRDLKYGEDVIPARQVHLSTLSTLKAYAKVLTLEEFNSR